MPLIVQPVEEKDLQVASEIHNAAFGSSSNIHRTIYPNGATEYAKANMLTTYQSAFNDYKTSCYKVVDTDNNDRMVAWIDWKTFEHDQPESEWKNIAGRGSGEAHPDINSDFIQIFFGGLTKLKHDTIKGKPRVHISILATDPEYHRRGCGKLLLDKCADQADKLRLPTFLEASPMAAALYIREGFVPVEGAVLEVDMRPFGYDQLHKTVLMKRPAGGN